MNRFEAEQGKIVVYDNFLPDDVFSELQQEAKKHSYELVAHGNDIAYKLNTGDIYKTTRKYWSHKKPEKFQSWFSAMNELNPVPDSSEFSLMVHAYKAGAEIDWHVDYSSIASYSFYIHDDWKPQWGGNLLVANAENTIDVQGNNGTVFDNNPSVMSPGYGSYFAPIPNRLVIIKGVFHKVERVDQAAGNNMRMSFTGFFKNEMDI